MRQEDRLHPDRLIARLAAARSGVVSHTELLAGGLSDQQIWRRLQSGRLRRVHRGVYAIGGADLPARGRWQAALLAAGQGAALSHRSGGAAVGLSVHEGPDVELTVPPSGRLSPPGLVVHATRLEAGEIVEHRGLPVLAAPRLMLSLASIVSLPELERLVAEAAHKGILDPTGLEELLDRCRGRRGIRALRIASEGFCDVSRTRSVPEGRFQLLCSRYGIPPPCVNVPVGDREVDFFWPEERLIVEIDGFSAHRHRSRFESDRARAVELRLDGYEYLPFTPRQLDARVVWVARAVLRALAQRRRPATAA
jgi:hypothetical protein